MIRQAPSGTLIRIVQLLHRTIFPLAAAGTDRIVRHRRFGQIIFKAGPTPATRRLTAGDDAGFEAETA